METFHTQIEEHILENSLAHQYYSFYMYTFSMVSIPVEKYRQINELYFRHLWSNFTCIASTQLYTRLLQLNCQSVYQIFLLNMQNASNPLANDIRWCNQAQKLFINFLAVKKGFFNKTLFMASKPSFEMRHL